MADDLTQMPLVSGTMAASMPLDTSGKALSNRVINEPHTLLPRRFRALVLNQGAFYTEGSIFTDATTGRKLDVGIDYRYIVPYQSLTLFYGREVVGGIIIINAEVSNSITATYQAVGSDYIYNIPALEELLSTDNNSEVSKSFLDLQNRDLQVVPTPHMHSLGDGIGFEYLVFAIEAMCRVITYGDGKILASMFDRIDIKLQEIAQTAKTRQDGELMDLMVEFRKNFSKESLGLGKVPNLPAATLQDGYNAANPDFALGGEINNKLTTIQTLMGFRDALMGQLVSSATTALGNIYGTYLMPTMAGVQSMVNGARFIIDSPDATMIAGVPYDPQIYPDLSNPTTRWVLEKVSNNKSNRGGILRAINMQTGQMYLGVLSFPAGNPQIIWRKHVTEEDMDEIMKKLTNHILNHNNPHQVGKADVKLDQVQNFPVADRLTILSRKPADAYVTASGLQLFWAAIITDDWKIDDSEGSTPEQLARARNAYTTLFSSAGICCGDNGVTLETAPRPTDLPVPPRGQPAGWYCEGTTMIQKITDGFGGYYLENIYASEDCGYIAEVANYEIRDQNNGLIGLGFRAGGRVDPSATVGLQNEDGQTMCFIYPTPATGRTVTVMNANNFVLGYAIDPR